LLVEDSGKLFFVFFKYNVTILLLLLPSTTPSTSTFIRYSLVVMSVYKCHLTRQFYKSLLLRLCVMT